MADAIVFQSEEREPSLTYKIVNGRIMGKVDGLEAMRQHVEKTLSTERLAYLIYSESYGSEHFDLIGEDMEYAKAEIERLITEALIPDERVISIENFTIVETDKSSLSVKYDVVTVFGNIEQEGEVTL